MISPNTSTSSTALRLLALLFLLAALLLLREPLFGQSIASLPTKPAAQTIGAAPTRFSVVIEGATRGSKPDLLLIPGLASSRNVYADEAKLLTTNYRLHLIQLTGFASKPAGANATGPVMYDHPAIFDKAVQSFLKA
jgi:hypothetical protein